MNTILFNKLSPSARIPQYQTSGSAGADLHCVEGFSLKPGERKLVSLGFSVAIPDGFEIQIRSRSGLALRDGILVVNSPGTIDSDYRNEVKVILGNFGEKAVEFPEGSRIAQMVVAKVEKFPFLQVEELPSTDRRGGFGSTGV